MTSAAIEGRQHPSSAKGLDRLLVIGCGNLTAGDDGAGLEILRRLEALAEPGCALRRLPMSDIEIFDLLGDADMILIVDAVSSGAAPGTLYLLTLPSATLERRSVSTLSSHGWGLRESIELARALGRRLPRLVVLGVEVGTLELGVGRSAAVERAIAAVVENFPRLRDWLLQGGEVQWNDPRDFFRGGMPFQGDLKCA